jgi:transcriptional regulator with XRE-family HTH domain
MTAAEQLGSQLKQARDGATMSLRDLSKRVDISPSTLGEYERGTKVPEADKLAKIAAALGKHTFEIDEYRFTITHKEKIMSSQAQQLNLDFAGEYAFSKATVRVSPGRINILFDGITPEIQRLPAS